MTGQPAHHDTFVIERTYPAPPSKVFRALTDPAAKAQWFLPPGDWTFSGYRFDCRVGGSEHVESRPPGGEPHVYDAVYHEVVPDRRVVFAYDMRLAQRLLCRSPRSSSPRSRVAPSSSSPSREPSSTATPVAWPPGSRAPIRCSATSAAHSSRRMQVTTGERRIPRAGEELEEGQPAVMLVGLPAPRAHRQVANLPPTATMAR